MAKILCDNVSKKKNMRQLFLGFYIGFLLGFCFVVFHCWLAARVSGRDPWFASWLGILFSSCLVLFGASLLGGSSESSCRIHVVLAVPFISQLEVTLLVLGYVWGLCSLAHSAGFVFTLSALFSFDVMVFSIPGTQVISSKLWFMGGSDHGLGQLSPDWRCL